MEEVEEMGGLMENATLGDAQEWLSPGGIRFFLPNMSEESGWKSGATEFNVAGMQRVYELANWTLASVFPPYQQYLTYAKNFSDYNGSLSWSPEALLQVDRSEWEALVWENKGPLAVLLASMLFILLLTLWGVCWLFAKCCCGDKGCCLKCLRSKDADELISAKLEQKRDKCKRNFCGVLFAAIIVLFMFGLVCCFVTNEQMRIAVEDLPEDVDNSLADVDTYLNVTQFQINALFVHNYDLLSATLNHILDQSGEIIKNGLSQRTGAQTLDNLTDILDTVERVRANVVTVERISRSLQEKVARLKSGLTDSKERLLSRLDQCNSPRCNQLKNMAEIRSLRVQNDFQNALAMYYPKLPNMTGVLHELGLLLGTDVRRSIEEGKQAFNELGLRIKSEVDPVLPEIRILIEDTGRELANVARALGRALHSVPVDEARDDVERLEAQLRRYEPFRYYFVLGVCLTLAFIFTLLSLGIFVGFCGRQPGSNYSNECCSRKTGSSFLNCGIFFMFFTGGLLMVVSVAHFGVAGTLTQVVCEAVAAEDNRTQEALQIPTIQIRSKYEYQFPPYHQVVRECRNGASAYVAFQLQPVYDIEEVRSLSNRFKKKARMLASQVSLPVDATERIVFLKEDAKEQLSRFSSSKLNRINFDGFADQLDESIISVDLREIISELNDTVEQELDMGVDVRTRLQNEILILESLQEKVLLPMVDEVGRAAESLRFLSQQQQELSSRVDFVTRAAQEAQQSLHTSNAREQVRLLAREFEGRFVRHVEDYAEFTYQSVKESVGECSPLHKALNATVSTFCQKIGWPLSAFWFSLTALLLLFLPLLLIAMSLSRLYRKYKYLAYESETYYSTYGDGDTIPLSLNANANRRGNKRGRESATQSAAAHSRRFEDTSQKAWGSQLVFNSHHTPPASGEYERPPPYYYPGPAAN